MWLGAHIGISDGLAEAVRTAKGIGCEAMQIFSKSPQMWAGPPIAPAAADEFRAARAEQGIKAAAVHHGYLVNLASPKKPMLGRSRKTFLDELQRAEMLGVDHLIFHPGAHLGSGRDEGIRLIVESLDGVFAKTPGFQVRVLLENSAGQGSSIGSTFLDLHEIVTRVAEPARVGVAIDTCHLLASGVEFRTPTSYGEVVDRLDAELGVAQVRAFHLNDAKAELGSHLDRHENIGRGQIGLAGFAPLLNDARWANVPGYLETPLRDDTYDAYVEDLAALRSVVAPTASAAPSAPARKRRVAPTNG